jgi:ABC-type multidrug transport system permease subunit
MLNAVAGLFIGFSFWNSPDDVAGLQNKLFAVFSTSSPSRSVTVSLGLKTDCSGFLSGRRSSRSSVPAAPAQVHWSANPLRGSRATFAYVQLAGDGHREHHR